MKGIQYLKGDATNPQSDGNKIIAHICNDIGGWGKGFVTAISKKWKQPEAEYRRWYREGKDFSLGEMQIVEVEKDIWISNMIAQHKIISQTKGISPIRYEAVEKCLEKLTFAALKLNAEVHMPRIGCGLAGGKWDEIEPIIEKTLVRNNIQVYVYDFE